jgi:hypothetical protein
LGKNLKEKQRVMKMNLFNDLQKDVKNEFCGNVEMIKNEEMNLKVLKGFKPWKMIVRVTTNDFENIERTFDLVIENDGLYDHK